MRITLPLDAGAARAIDDRATPHPRVAERVTLREGQVWSCARPAGLVILIERGTAWVTHEGTARDLVLAAGQTAGGWRRGKVVVQALGEVRLTIERHQGISTPLMCAAALGAQPRRVASNVVEVFDGSSPHRLTSRR